MRASGRELGRGWAPTHVDGAAALWREVVETARRARDQIERYLEVRYEDLCRHPVRTLGEVFDFLGVPYRKSARDWIAANASTEGIGKWRGREGELADAIKLGEPLLRELGYW